MIPIEQLRDELKAVLPPPWRLDYDPAYNTFCSNPPTTKHLECRFLAKPEDAVSVVSFFQDAGEEVMCGEISEDNQAGFRAGLALMGPICEKYDIRIVEEI